jgi:poly(beta-D-mannuronate) lyase
MIAKAMKKHIIPLLILICNPFIINSQELNKVFVSNAIEFNKAIKEVKPGATIVLKNGSWKNVDLLVEGWGTKEKPITIEAETSGKVIISGNSKLQLAGEYLVVKGLWFKDGAPTSKSIISFKKNSTEFANNSRLTDCTITNYNPENPIQESHWVGLWGKNNRVDHCHFSGKTNGGTTLVVWLKGNEHIENNHRIDHNYFGFRPDLGRNGGETVRIGTSTNSQKSSKTIVENNIFKNCNGEIEIISNKSCDNIFRNNIFLESKGTLTLRHGHRALVEKNIFIGNNKKHTGGIRIINEGHVVQNNLLIGITGDDYRGPIVFMNGVPNSPLNRYHQVKNVLVQNNTMLNCSPIQISAGKDSEKTLAPINSKFINNIVSNTNAGKIINFKEQPNGIVFENNFTETNGAIDENYFKKVNLNWEMLGSLPMLTTDNLSLVVNNNENSPKTDFTGAKRNQFVAGAFNLGNKTIPPVLKTKAGPSYKVVVQKANISTPKPITIKVKPGNGSLERTLKGAPKGSTLLLLSGIHFVKKTIKVRSDLNIIGTSKDSVFIKASEVLEKPLSYFFRVEENVTLNLKKITFDGLHKSNVKYAIVSPDENKKEKYNLYIDDCRFQNFTNKSGGAIFKAYVNTLADTISIKNTIFQNSYRGLNLSYQKDNLGSYNAEVILLKNNVFKRIEEYAINYSKSGFSLKNKGGKLIVENCIFSRVANFEKGYILKVKGITKVEISNSVFEKSFEIKTPINLMGIQQSIKNSVIFACGQVKATNKENLIYKNPKWEDSKLFIPSKKSILLKENNKIATIGLVN